jgi:putrescine aminotransferase
MFFPKVSPRPETKNRDPGYLLKEIQPLQEILSLSPEKTARLYHQHLNPVIEQISRFLGMNRRFVQARGAWLRDDQGHSYLDFLSGFGALNLGHEPAVVLEALRLVEERPNILQSWLNPFAAKLGEALALISPGDLTRSFFCNSGAEAVEAALKIARKATGRRVLLSAEGAYHGKTFGALSVSGKKKYKEPFEPLIPETEQIPYGNLEALKARLARGDVAAFLVEPIQGENGVVLPHAGYLKESEKICRSQGVLLLADEIQTGMGRTGKMFAVDHEGAEPDVLILSKSLGGGAIPIGAIVVTEEVWKKAYGNLETGLLHSSTFGGNTRACAAAIASIRMILEEGLCERAAVMGELLLSGLKKLQAKYSVLKDVRGKGLMIGLQFVALKGNSRLVEGALTLWSARRFLTKHRIITAFTMNNLDVLRIAPPLIISEEEVRRFLEAADEVLKAAEKFRALGLVKKE